MYRRVVKYIMVRNNGGKDREVNCPELVITNGFKEQTPIWI